MSGLTLRSVIWMAGTILAVSFAQANAAEQAGEPQDSVMELSSAATDAELDSSRGAFLPSSLNINNVEQTAQSNNNLVIGGSTGANIIGNGSFTNTQGLVNVIQNSGNNVIIQSSTVVNMTFGK